MSDRPNISVNVLAGPIYVISSAVNSRLGSHVRMGDDLSLHITPEVAAQWLPVIQKIAEEK